MCDGHTVLIPGIIEHIERAGIHSGDSFAVYPPITLTVRETERVVESTALIARLVSAVGLINIQFVIRDGIPHVLEVNPRASRTVPFLSKVTGVPMVALATHAALGRSLVEQGFSGGGLWSPDYQAVVGLVGKANVGGDHRGDGQALTLKAAAAALPTEKLDLLTDSFTLSAGWRGALLDRRRRQERSPAHPARHP